MILHIVLIKRLSDSDISWILKLQFIIFNCYSIVYLFHISSEDGSTGMR